MEKVIGREQELLNSLQHINITDIIEIIGYANPKDWEEEYDCNCTRENLASWNFEELWYELKEV